MPMPTKLYLESLDQVLRHQRWILILLAKYFYRPGQPILEYTMRKFQDFSATQILGEIILGHFKAVKNAILSMWAALNFEFLDIFVIRKCEI